MFARTTAPVLALALGLAVGPAPSVGSPGAPAPAPGALAPRPVPGDDEPLAGKVVVLDPGHQLGNRNFPRQIGRPVPAGGFRKPCNTTGTATNGGYPEATFTWQVARLVRERLRRLGARVLLTRHSNRADRWGPCVDERGRAGNAIGADLLLSIHADGSYAANARGFHVITVPGREQARQDALAVRAALRAAGLPVATYVAGGDGLDERRDLATLNLARVPAVLVELGNMRDRRDAARMTSAAGRSTYAKALAAAIREKLSDNGTDP